MKLLPDSFPHDGFVFRQLCRQVNLAVYSQEKDGQRVAYELVVVKQSPEWTAFGKTFPAAESYPKAHEWGTHGWTFSGPNAEAELRAKANALGWQGELVLSNLVTV
jgi:hypothetical protein